MRPDFVSWWKKHREQEPETQPEPLELPPKLSREEWDSKLSEFYRLQHEEWQKHFEEHPEQELLPGIFERKRNVTVEEMGLLAELIWNA